MDVSWYIVLSALIFCVGLAGVLTRRNPLVVLLSLELLLKRFLIPFEAASYLLLIAAVGAVVLARRRRGLEHLDAEVAPGAQG